MCPAWLPTADLVFGGLALLVASSAVSLAVVAAVLVGLPADYFLGPRPPHFGPPPGSTWRVPFLLAKNLVGVAVVALGVVLSLPGVPGQGFLTILIGLMLLDFVPGKRRLEKWFVARPSVRRGIDAMRARFRRPPLVLDVDPPGATTLPPAESQPCPPSSPAELTSSATTSIPTRSSPPST